MSAKTVLSSLEGEAVVVHGTFWRASTCSWAAVWQVLFVSLIVTLAAGCIGGQGNVDVGGEGEETIDSDESVGQNHSGGDEGSGEGATRGGERVGESANGRSEIVGRAANAGGGDSGEETNLSDESGGKSADGGDKGPGQDAVDIVMFPQHEVPLRTDQGGEYLVAKLVLDGKCLRADFPTLDRGPSSTPRKSLLLVWPETFTLSTEDGVARVVDANGRIAAHVGDHFRTTYVAVSFQQARDQGLIHGLSEDCPGPYMLAGEEVTAISLNGPDTLVLSDPELHFPLQGTAVGEHEVLGAEAIGELVLEGHCLRLKSTDRPSRLLFWPSGFTPHVYRGVIHVRNGAGRIIAQVGDRIAMGGAAGPYWRYNADKTIGPKCPGPSWAPNHITVLQKVDIYFPQQDGTLGTDQDMDRFVGRLVLESRCLMIADAVRVSDRVIMGRRYLPIWPDSFTLNLEGEVAGIVNAVGREVARVGDEIQFSAVSVSYQEGLEHGGLRQITPACSGGYWVVGEDFVAVPDSESQ